MALTPAQKQTLKTNIQATPEANALYVDGNLDGLAAYYNVVASPDFWVWRTNVSRADIYNLTSPAASTWNWTTYKNQGVAEQNAWVQMFMGDLADFSKTNLRDGVAAIFTGSAQANAQRDHVLATGRRLSNRLEQVFANGTGSSASPGTMVVEGALHYTELIGL